MGYLDQPPTRCDDNARELRLPAHLLYYKFSRVLNSVGLLSPD